MATECDRTLLIQFARSPVPGGVKTRMLPRLSPEQACDLHSELVLWTCRTLVQSRLGVVELAVAGDQAHPLFERCRELGLSAVSGQYGQDLGENMFHAIRDGLSRYSKVVLVGSDCPSIDKAYLAEAVRALDGAPLVLGPAEDGGYVLIGARRICPELFAGIRWGTASVYADTVMRLEALGWAWVVLPALADIDRAEDLALWQVLRGQSQA